MKKKELRALQDLLGKLAEMLRQPRYKNQKLPYDVFVQANDAIDVVIDAKKDEPDDGELWLVLCDKKKKIGEIIEGRIYFPGDEEGRGFTDIDMFIKRIDIDED